MLPLRWALYGNFNKIIKSQNKNNIFFVGNCGILYKDMIESVLNDKAIIFPDSDPTSTLVGFTAFDEYNLEEVFDSFSLNPLYLKKSNAELQQEKK